MFNEKHYKSYLFEEIMFGKLKDKLKNWTKKVSEEVEEPKEIVEIAEKKEPVKKEILEKLKDNVQIPKEAKQEIKTIEPEVPKIEKEESTPGEKGFLKKITSKINKIEISEKEFEVYSEELEMLLLENNVALEVAEKIIQELKDKITGKEFLKKEIEGEIKESFKEIIEEILIQPFDVVEKIKEKKSSGKEPYVVLFCGINGTGKTTVIAKIAQQLKDNNLSCVLAAADTFRAASIEQIKKHGEKLGVKVVAHDYNSDPAAVGFDAIKYAKKNKLDAVLIDTAGRMYTEKNLMNQIEKVSKVTNPDIKIFVGESIAGNDIVEQVKSFDWAISIDGMILNKADIDEKGGTALSVGYVTKKPILYLGTGQEYDKIEPFDKKKFIEKLGL